LEFDGKGKSHWRIILKIYRFDAEIGKSIGDFGSRFILSRIVRLNAEAQISCFHLSSHGKVGYHQAVTPQLFLVVGGDGWVRNDTSGKVPVSIGRAAFWDKDEWHEAGTDTSLIAIVIEGELPDLSGFMPVEWDGS
jgi:hypothetical protein